MGDAEGPANEELVRCDFSELKKIASGKDSATKKWLREFLNHIHDTPEVRELRALLR